MKIEIPRQILPIAKKQGFVNWFWLIKRRNNYTDIQAYEEVENIHEKYWGERMYKSFESFRQCRDYKKSKA